MRQCDLFAGIGGFSLAASWYGIKTTQFVEIDLYCQSLLAKNFPGVPIHDDIKSYFPKKGEFDVITAGFPCFVAGTMILTNEGYKPIEEVRKGDLVLTHKGRWKPVVQTNVSFQVPTRTIQGRGVNIETTDEHPFWAQKRYRQNNIRRFTDHEWVKAESLTTEHFCSTVLPPIELFDISDEELWLLGRYVADGYLLDRLDRKHGGRVVFCVPEIKSKEFESKLVSFGASKCAERTCNKYHITRNSLYEKCKEFGRGAENKVIPCWVMSLPKRQAEVFLDGYLSGDGCITNGMLKATTVSPKLAFGLSVLFQRVLERVPSISLVNRPKTCVIEGRTVNQKNTWTVYLKEKPKRQTVNFTKGDYGYFQVRKNTPTGTTATVYNIGVAEDESYIANGFIVHNCQDLSSANPHGRGLEGKRSGLFFEVVRILRTVQPRFLLLENVPNLINRGLDRVLWEIAQSGFDAEWQVISAASMGAPHRRERIFVIAYPMCSRRQKLNFSPVTGQSDIGSGGCDAPTAYANGLGCGAKPMGFRERTDSPNSCSQITPNAQSNGRRSPGSKNLQTGADSALISNLLPTTANPHNVPGLQANPTIDAIGTEWNPRDDAQWGDRRNESRNGGRQAQSRICGMDDGLSPWMDGHQPSPLATGIPHYQKRLKALGNSVVPQAVAVAYQRIMEINQWTLKTPKQ
jgi:site-specific DNA-cytosine methylase